MKRGQTLFLKLVIFLIGFGAIAGMIRFPKTEGRAENLNLVGIYTDPFIIYLYIASLPFFAAMHQALKLLGYIDENKIFSRDAVKAVRNIKYCAIALIGFIVAAILYIFVIAKATNDDSAGAIAIGLVTIFAASVIATATAVLEKLLQNVVDIKSENDLTV